MRITPRHLTICECRPPWRDDLGPDWTRFQDGCIHHRWSPLPSELLPHQLCKLVAVGDIKFGTYTVHVAFDRANRHGQPFGDFPVRPVPRLPAWRSRAARGHRQRMCGGGTDRRGRVAAPPHSFAKHCARAADFTLSRRRPRDRAAVRCADESAAESSEPASSNSRAHPIGHGHQQRPPRRRGRT